MPERKFLVLGHFSSVSKQCVYRICQLLTIIEGFPERCDQREAQLQAPKFAEIYSETKIRFRQSVPRCQFKWTKISRNSLAPSLSRNRSFRKNPWGAEIWIVLRVCFCVGFMQIVMVG